MAWYLPRNPLVTTYIVDMDDINDSLALAAHESAFLTEANWAADALTGIQDAGDAEHDIVMSIYKTVNRQDPHAGGVAIAPSLSWVEVTGTEVTFQSRGGVIEVDASFQINNEPTTTTSEQTGLQFCIAVDGTPRLESLIGSGDMGNDQAERPTLRFDGTTGAFAAVAGTYFGTGPAIKAQQIGLSCQLSIPIEPGDHRVALVARNLSLANTGLRQFMSQRVMLVKEFWATGK